MGYNVTFRNLREISRLTVKISSVYDFPFERYSILKVRLKAPQKSMF